MVGDKASQLAAIAKVHVAITGVLFLPLLAFAALVLIIHTHRQRRRLALGKAPPNVRQSPPQTLSQHCLFHILRTGNAAMPHPVGAAKAFVRREMALIAGNGKSEGTREHTVEVSHAANNAR